MKVKCEKCGCEWRLGQEMAKLGAKGGAAGTGDSKRRGGVDYYKHLSAKAVEARRKKQAAGK